MSSPFDPPNRAAWPMGKRLLVRLFPNGLTLEMRPLFWRMLVTHVGRPQATAFMRWHFSYRFREPATLHTLSLAERKLYSEMTATLLDGGFFAWVHGEPAGQYVPFSPWHGEAAGRIRRAFPDGLSEEQVASLLRIVAPELSFRCTAQLMASVTNGCYIDWLQEVYGYESMDPTRDKNVYDRLVAVGFIAWFKQTC